MSERPCGELFDPAKEECTAGDHESARPQLDQLCEGCIEVTFGADIEDLEIQPEGVSRCLQLPCDGIRESGIGRVDQQGYDASRGDQLMQQFQPLLRYLHISLGDPRDVAARTVKARNEAELNRVAVRVLSKLFRRLMLEKLLAAHGAGRLKFLGSHADLADAKTFAAFLAPLRKKRWFVYAKRPFAGPKAVLAYLSRYTHRVAISNHRLIAVDQRSVTFKVKDYRIEGPGRYTTMTLDVGEFIRRFLIHVLPKGFHRIRHYGLFASTNRAETIARVRKLLGLATPAAEAAVEIDPAAAQALAQPCPCCGGRMFVIETFDAGCQPRYRPTAMRIDTS